MIFFRNIAEKARELPLDGIPHLCVDFDTRLLGFLKMSSLETSEI